VYTEKAVILVFVSEWQSDRIAEWAEQEGLMCKDCNRSEWACAKAEPQLGSPNPLVHLRCNNERCPNYEVKGIKLPLEAAKSIGIDTGAYGRHP
jgi:hypothetical protein